MKARFEKQIDELSRDVVIRLGQIDKFLMVAESCTAGLLGHSIARTPGASKIFWGGLIVYSNSAKQILAGVDPEIIQRSGAVSEETVDALLHGLLQRFPIDAALAVSGIAGPGGGTPEKPVGTVYIGSICRWLDKKKYIQRCRFEGERVEIQAQAVIEGMKQLLTML